MSWLSEAIHHSDAPIISAVAAWAVAGITATVAGIQFFIGRKQAQAALTSADAALMNAKNAGRYRIAEFRQEWIDKVIDILSEQHAILAADSVLSSEDQRRVALLGMKLGLLLNPEEKDTIILIDAMDKVVGAKTAIERAAKTDEATIVARRLLKREWTRLKTELGSSQ